MNSVSTRPMVARYWIVIAVMSSTIMEIIDTSVVNVSLPHIAGNLSASIPDATWAITSYIVANAVILPMTGWLSNFFGRKRLLMTVITDYRFERVVCVCPKSSISCSLPSICRGSPRGTSTASQAVLLEDFLRRSAVVPWRSGGWVSCGSHPRPNAWRMADRQLLLAVGIPDQSADWYIELDAYQGLINDPPHIKRGSLKVDGWGIGMLALGMGALQIMLDKGQDRIGSAHASSSRSR